MTGREWIRAGAGPVALAVVAPCALLAALAEGGRYSSRLDILTHFTLVFLFGCIAGGLLWMASDRRKLAAPILATIGTSCCLILTAPELAAAGGSRARLETGQRPLRLLQFNIWKNNTNPHAAAAWIIKTNPDIAALEDSDGPGNAVVVAVARHYPYRVGVGDTYIFSKTPITYTRRINGGSSVMAHVLLPGGGEADIVALHILWPLFRHTEALQRRTLIADVQALPKPDLIVAGDFNLTPWSFAMKEVDAGFGLERRTHGLPTWPARWALVPPFLSIDQVFAGSNWKTVSIKRGPRLGSDHYPILATLVRD